MSTPDTQPADQHAKDLADKSGLFGDPPKQHQTADKPQPTAKPPKPTIKASKPTKGGEDKGKGKGTIGDRDRDQERGVSSAPAEHEPTEAVFIDPVNKPPTLQELHDALNLVWPDKSRRWSTLRIIYNALKKYHGLKDRYEAGDRPTGPATSREMAEPITRQELINRISEAVRSPDATDAGISSLTKALHALAPDLFADIRSTAPPPESVIDHIAAFAGRPGAEIAAELGGREFLAARLSEILQTPVILPDPAK